MLGSSDGRSATPTTWPCSTSTGSSTSAVTRCPARREHLARARDAGMRLAFITNNAARPPERGRRAPARAGGDGRGATTSSPRPRRPARLLVDRFGAGARGRAAGRRRAARRRCSPRAWSRWRCDDEARGDRQRLRARRACGATSCGPRSGSGTGCRGWPATPTARSRRAYGVGARARRAGGDARARSAASTRWSPASRERPLLDETVRRVGGERPLMVGDRLDTDIDGARNAGLDSLLVMTGVTGLRRAGGGGAGGAADVHRRRTWPACSRRTHAPGRDGRRGPALGGWRAGVESGRLVVDGDGERRRLVAGGRGRGLGAPRRDRRRRWTSTTSVRRWP